MVAREALTRTMIVVSVSSVAFLSRENYSLQSQTMLCRANSSVMVASDPAKHAQRDRARRGITLNLRDS